MGISGVIVGVSGVIVVHIIKNEPDHSGYILDLRVIEK